MCSAKRAEYLAAQCGTPFTWMLYDTYTLPVRPSTSSSLVGTEMCMPGVCRECADAWQFRAHRLAMAEPLGAAPIEDTAAPTPASDDVTMMVYPGEHILAQIIALVAADLSEPYSIYTYRYFINNWPKLCHVVRFTGCSVSHLFIHTRPCTRGGVSGLSSVALQCTSTEQIADTLRCWQLINRCADETSVESISILLQRRSHVNRLGSSAQSYSCNERR